MANPGPLKINLPSGNQGGTSGIKPAGQTPYERAIELSKRSMETHSLDELLFLLTNDTRTIIEFERAWLVTHLGGPSRLAATNNQPTINARSAFVEHINKLAGLLRGKDKAVFLSSRIISEDTLGKKVAPDLKEALKSYTEFSGFSHILIMPLVHNEVPVGHLSFEFQAGKIPREDDILGLLNVTPFLAAALAEKSLLDEKPDLIASLRPREAGQTSLIRGMKTYLPLWVLLAVGVAITVFVVPFSFTVGGEAEIVPKVNNFAFAGIEGLVDKVLIREGDRVEKGQVLASLDPKELDYQTTNWKSQYEILTREIGRLSMEAGDNPGRLVEKKIAELKRQEAWNELQYLNWKRGFLEIKSPVSGIIMSKDIQSLAGKRLGHGEPFCEIAAPEQLQAQVYVPEDRIYHVKQGQTAYLYLNSDPARAHELKVTEVSPNAEVRPRLGSVYRVRAPLGERAESLKVGMKGVGKIHTDDTSLWTIVTSQLRTRWNQFALHF